MTGYTPGSLAVAMAYEAPGAPRVVAKGDGELGRRIIETAEANGMPIDTMPVSQVLLSNVEHDEEIPVELYKAAAEVIAFVLQLRRNRWFARSFLLQRNAITHRELMDHL